MHAAHLMRIDCPVFKSGDNLTAAVRAAIEKKIDILPIIDNTGRLSGIINLTDISGRINDINFSNQTGLISLIDTDFTGTTPDASMERIATLLKGNARPIRSMIVHDNRGRFLGIIQHDFVMQQAEHNRGRVGNHS